MRFYQKDYKANAVLVSRSPSKNADVDVDEDEDKSASFQAGQPDIKELLKSRFGQIGFLHS